MNAVKTSQFPRQRDFIPRKEKGPPKRALIVRSSFRDQ
jgi:hypothetical protein